MHSPSQNLTTGSASVTPATAPAKSGAAEENGRVTATTATPPRPARSRPPRRRGRLSPWLLLGGCLLLAAAPVLIDLQRPGIVDPDETLTVATSAETWRQLHAVPSEGWSLEPFTPVYLNRPRFDAAPGTTWLHLAALGLSRPEELSASQMTLDARLVSAVMGLLAVAAMYWAGFSIGGLAAGCFTALVYLAMPVFLYDCRIGNQVAPSLGFSLLSIAAALWAIRPLRPTASLIRQGLGWAISGVALGLAILTAGANAIAPILLPVLMILLLCPQRINHLLGLVAAVFIAALLVTPWVVYALEQDPQVWRYWLAQVASRPTDAAEIGTRAGVRALLLLAAVLPWTLWLIGALLQPFSTSSAGARQRMFLGWSWFVLIAVWTLLRPGIEVLRVLAPVLPAAAILIGQLFQQLTELSAEGRHARAWRLLRWPHLTMLLVVSIVLPLGMHFQSELAEHGYLTAAVGAPMHWGYWAGAGVVLVAITLLSLHWAIKHYPGRTVVAWSVWTVAAFIVLVIPVARGPLFENPPA